MDVRVPKAGAPGVEGECQSKTAKSLSARCLLPRPSQISDECNRVLRLSRTARSRIASGFQKGNAMKLLRRQFLHLAAGAAALPAVSRIARAQSYPTRP